MPLLHLGREDGVPNRQPFDVNAELVATGRTCVIGTSGSGKSYTVGVICEELCKNQIPFVIIDIEGEYSGLKEKYEAIWIGDDEKCDLNWKGLDLNILAQNALDSVPLILDLSETERPKDKVGTFLSAVYQEISKRRTPYLVVLEEADRFAPQSGQRLQIFDEVARRGRKRGLGLMLCTQRPSLIDKNILSQCANQIVGKLVIKNDLQSVAQFFPGHGLPNQLTALGPGQFFVMGGLCPAPTLVKFRVRETKHGGVTPRLVTQPIRPTIEKILANLKGNVQVTKEKPVLGLPLLIDPTVVPSIIKVEKSFKYFGERENIIRVDLQYRPLVEVAVRNRVGLLKKKFELMSFFLDGITGRLVELGDRLIFHDGMERFLGLEGALVAVLRALSPDQDSTPVEISGSTRSTEAQVRKALRALESRRLVRENKVGKVKMYRRLTDLPKIDLTESIIQLKEVDISKGTKLEGPVLKENLVREIVKGMWDGADVESFKEFYYPVY
ncbi:MAG: ATP-binding protein, partial [Nitrososphaerales archaeon]